MVGVLAAAFLIVVIAFVIWASRKNRQLEIEHETSAWAKKGPPLLVDVRKTYFDAEMAVKASAMTGADDVLCLAVLPVEKKGRLLWQGEDANGRHYELPELQVPAVISIGEETLPLLRASHLFGRLAESEAEWKYRKSLYPARAAESPAASAPRPILGECEACGKPLRAARVTSPTMRLTCRCGHLNILSKWGKCTTCRAIVPLDDAWIHSSYYDLKETQEWCCRKCFRHPSAPPPNQGEDDFKRGRLMDQEGRPITASV